MTIAGFWRRFGAFFIDMLILGVAGAVAGVIFHEQFAAMGAWGRALGFLIAVAYFGIMDSRAAGGGSVGKLILGLKVVRRDGAMLSVPAAFSRAAIFCAAYFLNGARIHVMADHEWRVQGQAILTGILILSVAYLLLFNRRTRQSLHDLAVGAFVVQDGAGAIEPPPQPAWRGHAAVVAIALPAMLVAAKLTEKQPALTALAGAYEAISALPGIDQVGVNQNVASFNGTTTRRLIIVAVVDAASADPESTATHIAQVALDTYAEAAVQDEIIVTLTSGYDIGIAGWWRSTEYARTPAQWRARPGKQRT